VSMSVDGLISGMDTTSLITQLIQAEAGQQTALKKRLTAAETSASAYRTVNTTFAAVRAAAESMLKPESWNATKASSSNTGSVVVSATNGAATGSMTFTVEKLAAAHTVMNKNTAGTWTSASSSYGTSTITVLDGAGNPTGSPITIADSNSDGTYSLTEAAAAINASSHGLTAAVLEHTPGEFGLLVTSKTTGAASKFSLSGTGTIGVPVQGADAEIKIGTGIDAVTTRSATNTFTGVMPGVTFTVSKLDSAGVTVSVTNDPDAVAAKMQSLVDAVNSALSTVKTYTNNTKGSTAALRGDYAVTQYSGQLLDAVSFAISTTGVPGRAAGSGGSPAEIGLSLTKDGKVTFDKAKFLAALKDTPELASRLATGADGPPAVPGVADRLLDVAQHVSDATTGSMIKLAEGQDSIAKDLKDRIEAWDLRLAKRKEALTRQFSAMETALSSLKNQSTWLAGQINGLPSYS
jgi:flagellar capping protein FliD